MGAATGYSVGSGQSFGHTFLCIISDIPNMQNHAELIISGSLGVPGLVQGLGNHVQETLRRVVNYVSHCFKCGSGDKLL